MKHTATLILIVFLTVLMLGCPDNKDDGKPAAPVAPVTSPTTTGTTPPTPGFGKTKFGPNNEAHIEYQCAQNADCTRYRLVQVFHIEAKSSPGKPIVPHNTALQSDNGVFGAPLASDDKGGYVVDRLVVTSDVPIDQTPFYKDSVTGTKTGPASLDDTPTNVKPGHIMFFEVCAYCLNQYNHLDPMTIVKPLDCISWQYDGDTLKSTPTTPPPATKPTPGFTGALKLWDKNH